MKVLNNKEMTGMLKANILTRYCTLKSEYKEICDTINSARRSAINSITLRNKLIPREKKCREDESFQKKIFQKAFFRRTYKKYKGRLPRWALKDLKDLKKYKLGIVTNTLHRIQERIDKEDQKINKLMMEIPRLERRKIECERRLRRFYFNVIELIAIAFMAMYAVMLIW